jgi:hypothetical protein
MEITMSLYCSICKNYIMRQDLAIPVLKSNFSSRIANDTRAVVALILVRAMKNLCTKKATQKF